jgi:hypothetical protein
MDIMNYYIGIRINSNRNIETINLFDLSYNRRYYGVKKISSTYEDYKYPLFINELENRYSYFIKINELQFNNILNINYKDYSNINILEFYKKIDLEEFAI